MHNIYSFKNAVRTLVVTTVGQLSPKSSKCLTTSHRIQYSQSLASLKKVIHRIIQWCVGRKNLNQNIFCPEITISFLNGYYVFIEKALLNCFVRSYHRSNIRYSEVKSGEPHKPLTVKPSFIYFQHIKFTFPQLSAHTNLAIQFN